ncbi:hypothetical protein MMC16_002201 [Acarospora aff. strigata]|nr:hypothetical protein [Acarospora aff. strigata]
MVRLSPSLTSLLMLLGFVLPQISASLSGMPLPNDDIILDAQALERQAGSSTEAQVDQGSTETTDQQSGAQIEPRQGTSGATSAMCEVFPLNKHYKVVVDFWHWDPEKDGKATEFEKYLQEKCGKENFADFWWKKFDSKDTPDTRFMFNVPYPAKDRMKGDMYELISDAIFQYTKKKIRIPCYMF